MGIRGRTAYYFLLPALLLTLPGCQSDFDMLQALEGADGPEVESMEESLEKSAQQALNRYDYAKAGKLYQQLASRDPENPRYKLKIADLLRMQRDYKKALPIYTSLLTDEREIDILEGIALCRMAMGELEEASNLLTEIMEREPERWKTLNAIGSLFAMEKKLFESVQYFKEALKYNPDNPAILNNVGLALALEEDYERAIKALKRASTLVDKDDPNRKKVNLNLALVYGISGDLENAEKTARDFLPEAALYNNLGIYAKVAKDYELAKTYLHMALAKSPVYYEKPWELLEDIEHLENEVEPASGSKSKKKAR